MVHSNCICSYYVSGTHFNEQFHISKASALVRHFHSKRIDVDIMAGEYLFSYTRAIFNTPVL